MSACGPLSCCCSTLFQWFLTAFSRVFAWFSTVFMDFKRTIRSFHVEEQSVQHTSRSLSVSWLVSQVLEGPRLEKTTQVTRARGRAGKDGPYAFQ